MTARNFIFMYALGILLPVILGFIFYIIYKDLDKRKKLKKLGKAKTRNLFLVLALISVGLFVLIYFAAMQRLIVSALVYFFLIYIVLDKTARYLANRWGRK